MALQSVGTVHNSGSSTTASTGTHGLTINEGDQLDVYINLNGPNGSTANQSGWTKDLDDVDPGSPTANHAHYRKIAGPSEPTSYTFDLDSLGDWGVVFQVTESTTGADIVVDAAINTAIEGANSVDLIVGAVDGEVLSDGAMSIIFAAKDWRKSPIEDYTQVDNSYINLVGDTGNQICAIANRVFATGETFSGNVTVQTADGSDNLNDIPYSAHISYVEDTGGAIVAALSQSGAVAASISGEGEVAAAVSAALFVTGTLPSPGQVSASVDQLLAVSAQIQSVLAGGFSADCGIFRQAVGGQNFNSTAYTDFPFDTDVQTDGDFASTDNFNKAVPANSLLYICYNLGFQQDAGSNRSATEGALLDGGVNTGYGRSTGYIRRSGGNTQSRQSAGCLMRTGATPGDMRVQVRREDSNTGSACDITANVSGLQMVTLPSGLSIFRARTTTNKNTAGIYTGNPGTITGLLGSANWDVVDFDTVADDEDTGFTHDEVGSPSVIDVPASLLLVITSVRFLTTSTNTRRQGVSMVQLRDNSVWGDEVGSLATCYPRGSNGCQEMWANCVGTLIDARGATSPALRLRYIEHSESGARTCSYDEATIEVVELPASAEVLRIFSDTAYQNFVSGSDTLDDNEWENAGSETEIDSAFSRINGSTVRALNAGKYLYMYGLMTERAVNDASRKTPRMIPRFNGVDLQYGHFDQFNRGDQSTSSTNFAGQSGACVHDSQGLTSGVDDMQVRTNGHETAANEQVRAPAGYLFWHGVELGSLEAGGGGTLNPIAAALAQVLTVQAEFLQDGAIAAALTHALTVQGALDGRGAALALLSQVLTVQGAITSDVVDIAATPSQALTVTGQLLGDGALQAVVDQTLVVAALLDARGALSASVAQVLTTQGALDGEGELASLVSQVATVSATASGGSGISAALNQVASVAAVMAARGELSGVAAAALTVTASAVSDGPISATLLQDLQVAAQIDGEADAAAVLSQVLTVAAELDGTATLSAALSQAATVSAFVDAVGAAAAVISAELTTSGTLVAVGEGAMFASVDQLLSVSAQVAATAEVQALLQQVAAVSGSAAGLDPVSAQVDQALTVQASLEAGGVLQSVMACALQVTGAPGTREQLAAQVAQQLLLQADVTGLTLAQLSALVQQTNVVLGALTGLGLRGEFLEATIQLIESLQGTLDMDPAGEGLAAVCAAIQSTLDIEPQVDGDTGLTPAVDDGDGVDLNG